VQVTTNGGDAAFESPDGRWLYYAKRNQLGLWRRPVAGGQEEQINGEANPFFGGLYEKGGCLLNPFSVDATVECFGFGSPRLRLLTRFRNDGHVRATGPSFAISPNGRWILYSRVVREQSDLMLVDSLNLLR
jgi:WD40-like Beta Propeller Repeat